MLLLMGAQAVLRLLHKQTILQLEAMIFSTEGLRLLKCLSVWLEPHARMTYRLWHIIGLMLYKHWNQTIIHNFLGLGLDLCAFSFSFCFFGERTCWRLQGRTETRNYDDDVISSIYLNFGLSFLGHQERACLVITG